MAQERLPALPALAVPDAADLVYVVDVNDATDHASGSSKKATVGSLPVTEAQVTGAAFSNWNSAYGWGNHALAGYLTAELNDLSDAVVWDDIPAGNVPALAVTQHETALTITESQISDLQSYLVSNPPSGNHEIINIWYDPVNERLRYQINDTPEP